jgi:transposase-like protein
MKKKVNHYSDELKLHVVEEYLSTSIGLEELQKKYEIRSSTCIYNWMVKFGLSAPTQEAINVNTAMAKETEKTRKEKVLESRINQLEKELEYEKLRTHALDTMIDIAERELKITIRKKSGAKQ